jgi:hypothetical protein
MVKKIRNEFRNNKIALAFPYYMGHDFHIADIMTLETCQTSLLL